MSSNEPAWFTSSYSGTQGGNCVQVAGHDGLILVRDTKDHGRGHVHTFTPTRWRAFVADIRDGKLDPDQPGHLG